jgi:hypothetical protein
VDNSSTSVRKCDLSTQSSRTGFARMNANMSASVSPLSLTLVLLRGIAISPVVRVVYFSFAVRIIVNKLLMV